MSTTNPQPEDSILLVKREGFVATLTFNRPVVLNAIDVPMARALRDASRQCACDRSIRAIVLCGAGNGFMAGGDLATLSADPAQGASDLLDPLNEALTHFANMDAPLIAKVHGVAAGAGMSLMMQADFVVAAEKTRFNLAYINIGASCDVGASWFLPRQVGLRRALEISMLGETMQVRRGAAHRSGQSRRSSGRAGRRCDGPCPSSGRRAYGGARTHAPVNAQFA